MINIETQHIPDLHHYVVYIHVEPSDYMYLFPLRTKKT